MLVDDILREVIADAAYRPEQDFLLNHPAFQALAKHLLTLEIRMEALEGKPPAGASVDNRLAELDASWRRLRQLQMTPEGRRGRHSSRPRQHQWAAGV